MVTALKQLKHLQSFVYQSWDDEDCPPIQEFTNLPLTNKLVDTDDESDDFDDSEGDDAIEIFTCDESSGSDDFDDSEDDVI